LENLAARARHILFGATDSQAKVFRTEAFALHVETWTQAIPFIRAMMAKKTPILADELPLVAHSLATSKGIPRPFVDWPLLGSSRFNNDKVLSPYVDMPRRYQEIALTHGLTYTLEEYQ
jgi:hypothetical protein